MKNSNNLVKFILMNDTRLEMLHILILYLTMIMFRETNSMSYIK